MHLGVDSLPARRGADDYGLERRLYHQPLADHVNTLVTQAYFTAVTDASLDWVTFPD